MLKKASGLLVISFLLALAGCGGGASKVDSGGVILEVGDFTQGLPIQVSASATTLPAIPTLTIHSILRDPTGTTSSLMDVTLDTLQVTFDRADRGTRVPPAYVVRSPGFVPANGSLNILNEPVMGNSQFNAQPLLDLRTYGVDRETGGAIATLNCHLTYFGKTLSGKTVQSEPFSWTMEVLP